MTNQSIACPSILSAFLLRPDLVVGIALKQKHWGRSRVAYLDAPETEVRRKWEDEVN